MQYHYKVKDLMIPSPVTIDQNASLKEAAEKMLLIGCGVMPVGTFDKLVGMITDRDITVRAVAKGYDPLKSRVSEIMTNKVAFVNENATLNQAIDEIRKQKVTRLIVKNLKGQATGIFSIGGLIRENADTQTLARFIHQLADRMYLKAA